MRIRIQDRPLSYPYLLPPLFTFLFLPISTGPSPSTSCLPSKSQSIQSQSSASPPRTITPCPTRRLSCPRHRWRSTAPGTKDRNNNKRDSGLSFSFFSTFQVIGQQRSIVLSFTATVIESVNESVMSLKSSQVKSNRLRLTVSKRTRHLQGTIKSLMHDDDHDAIRRECPLQYYHPSMFILTCHRCLMPV